MSMSALDNLSQASETTKQGVSIDELIAQAETCLSQHQFEEAKVLYSQVLESEPHRAIANYGLGMVEANSATILDALPYFEAAIKSDPNNEQYWVSYIDAMLLSNQFDKAKEAITLGQRYGLTEAFANQLLSECNPQPVTQQQGQQEEIVEHQYADFKEAFNAMLTINKREVAEYQSQLFSGAANTALSPDINCSPVESFFNQWLENGHFQEILTIAEAVVSQLVQTPELVGHKIYTPFLDQLLAKFDYNIDSVVPREQKNATIILASELYDYGGHTKEIATLLHNVDNPILVVTDIYNRFAASNSFETISSIFPDCPVVILPQEATLAKSQRLAALINQLAKNVYLLVHHNDSTAVAACQQSLDVNYYFIHHGDHNAALGNHTPHFKHVDLFANRADNCAEDLNQNTFLLPASTPDLGAKVFSDTQQTCATVTAGSFGKFKTEGAMSLSKLIIKSIEVTQSSHYHFGTIPDQDLINIKQDLANAGVDATQFVYQGNVASLWESLKAIDAHIFIGSAPVMGAKSDIEAQGAGYPLLAFRSLTCPRHLNVGSHASDTVYWHDIHTFAQGLNTIRDNHAQYASAAREFYLNHCTPEHYQRGLAMISE